jgi:hypothetical protein
MKEIKDIKVGDTIVFTGKEIFLEKENFIRATYFNEAGLNIMSVGARCRITKIHQSTFGYNYEMITLDCPNGEYEFLEHVVRENFTRCPREVAFETLGL